MNKTMEGMADAAWSADDPSVSGRLRNLPATEALEVRRMKAALLWLADNVSDEMADTADDACDFNSVRAAMRSEDWRFCIAAALRAAAGDGK